MRKIELSFSEVDAAVSLGEAVLTVIGGVALIFIPLIAKAILLALGV